VMFTSIVFVEIQVFVLIYSVLEVYVNIITVTEVFILCSLLRDQGHITKQSSACFPSVHRQTETEMFLILRSVTWCLVAATSDLETSGCFFVVAVGVLLFLQWVTMLVRHQASSL